MICTFSILYLVFAQIAVDSDAENGMFFQIEFRVDMIKLQSYFDVIRVSNQMLKIISFRCILRSIDDLLTEIHPMSNQTENMKKKFEVKCFMKILSVLRNVQGFLWRSTIVSEYVGIPPVIWKALITVQVWLIVVRTIIQKSGSLFASWSKWRMETATKPTPTIG